MKKYCIYIATIFTLMFMPNMVYAAKINGVCDYKIISEQRSLAGNVNITYSYRMEEGKPVFDITLSNLTEDMYIVDNIKNRTYDSTKFTADNEITLEGYLDDTQVKFQIYTKVIGCYGQLLTTRYVTLPNYNEYSTDENCVGAEEYSLCQRWGAVSVDYDEFVAKIKDYKSKKKAKAQAITFDKNETLLEKIFAFVGEYYAILVSVVIVIILVIGALQKIFLKKNQFDFKV